MRLLFMAIAVRLVDVDGHRQRLRLGFGLDGRCCTTNRLQPSRRHSPEKQQRQGRDGFAPAESMEHFDFRLLTGFRELRAAQRHIEFSCDIGTSSTAGRLPSSGSETRESQSGHRGPTG
jgi:hypothetical protein